MKETNTSIRAPEGYEFLEMLVKQGVLPWYGEASVQVDLCFATAKGLRILRLGVTDDDVGSGYLWFKVIESE